MEKTRQGIIGESRALPFSSRIARLPWWLLSIVMLPYLSNPIRINIALTLLLLMWSRLRLPSMKLVRFIMLIRFLLSLEND